MPGPPGGTVSRVNLSFIVSAVGVMLAPFVSGGLAAAPADTVPVRERRIAVQAYGPREGLRQRQATALAVSRDGHLWIATESSIVRFDGSRFDQFARQAMPALPNGRISGLSRASNGDLWIGLDGAGLAVRRAGTGAVEAIATSVDANQLVCLQHDRLGTLWAGTSRELVRWRDGRVTGRWTDANGLGAQGATSVAVHASGAIWVATPEGVLTLEGDRLTGLPQVATRSHSRVAESRHGGVWVATPGGLTRYDADGRVLERVGAERGWLDRGRASAIAEDDHGDVWVGLRNGLAQIRGGRVVAYLDRQSGLPDDWVNDVVVDRESNVWVATAQGGLARVWRTPVATIGLTEGLPAPVVYSVAEDNDGAVWIGTGDGAMRVHGDRATILGRADGLRNTAIGGLASDRDGGMWLGTEAGLAKYRRGRIAWHDENGLGRGTVYSVFQDRSGTVWAGTQGGMYVGRNGRFRPLDAKAGIEATSRVDAIVEDRDGVMWVTTTGQGLMRRQGDRFVPAPGGGPALSSIPQTLFADPDGSLWIGTAAGGLWHFRAGQYRGIGVADGLADEAVNGVLADGKGHLWVSSSVGIQRLSRQSLVEFLAGRVRQVDGVLYESSDGIADPETTGGTQPSCLRSRDGRLWFSTVRGVVVLDPQEPHRPYDPPPVFIDLVTVDGQAVDAGPDVRLPADSRRVEIRFRGISFSAAERLQYRYKLEGLDPDWVDIGSSRSVMLANLAPRSYRFFVQASVDGETWGPAADPVGITRLARFWQTWWFAALVVGGVTAAGLGLHATRVRLLRARSRELHEMVDSAMAQVRTLSGLLPVCAWCKKARDDRGYWTQLELYIQDRTDATVTHGLCPECSQRLQTEAEEADNAGR